MPAEIPFKPPRRLTVWNLTLRDVRSRLPKKGAKITLEYFETSYNPTGEKIIGTIVSKPRMTENGCVEMKVQLNAR